MARVPRISGRLLKRLSELARTKSGARVMSSLFRKDLDLDCVFSLAEDCYGAVPISTKAQMARPPRALVRDREIPHGRHWANTIGDSIRTGNEAAQTVKAVLAGIRRLRNLSPSMDPMQSTLDEQTLLDRSVSASGPLAGVPYVVKEETAIQGLAYAAGSNFETGAALADATVVTRLAHAGAIAIGTTVMTEFGLSPLGFNPKRAMPKNPHDPAHLAGGSSTGSGVAVATGLVPFALGVDGGGSVRIPAAHCGVFGLKPTWGRISRYGDRAAGSVAHIGILARSTADIAMVLDSIHGIDPNDPETAAAVAPVDTFSESLRGAVKGLCVVVDEDAWGAADRAIALSGERALREWEKAGVRLKPMRLPKLSHAPQIGYVTITIEERASQSSRVRDRFAEYNADLQLTYAFVGEIRASEYVTAQRARSGLRKTLVDLFQDVDAIARPTTVTTAPSASAAEMRSGFADAQAIDSVCRFNFLANLTGSPAISLPLVGGQTLPHAIQLIGDAWDEGTLLALGAELERLGLAAAVRPRITAHS